METVCRDHHECEFTFCSSFAKQLNLLISPWPGWFRAVGRNMGMLSKFEEAVQAKVGAYTPDGRSAMNRSADCKKVAMCEAKQHGRHLPLQHPFYFFPRCTECRYPSPSLPSP